MFDARKTTVILCNTILLCISMITLLLHLTTSSTTVSLSDYDEIPADIDPGVVPDWNPKWGLIPTGRLPIPKCVPIPSNLTLCCNIGYNQMRLPNLLHHDTLREVTTQASSWVHLTNIGCHPDTRLFLCSLFSPVCLDRIIWPCRSLCLAVQAGCEGRMKQYGFFWPPMLQCQQFPPDNDLCITVQSTGKQEVKKCPHCGETDALAVIVDTYCNAEFALQMSIAESAPSGNNMKLVPGNKKKVYNAGNMTKKELRNPVFYIDDVTSCNCTRKLQQIQSKKSGNFLIMGRRQKERFVLVYIQKIEKKSRDMQRALRAIKNITICRNGVGVITEEITDCGSKCETTRVTPRSVATERPDKTKKPKFSKSSTTALATEHTTSRRKGSNRSPTTPVLTTTTTTTTTITTTTRPTTTRTTTFKTTTTSKKPTTMARVTSTIQPTTRSKGGRKTSTSSINIMTSRRPSDPRNTKNKPT